MLVLYVNIRYKQDCNDQEGIKFTFCEIHNMCVQAVKYKNWYMKS